MVQCFCPSAPQLVDGRYVSHLSTVAGDTEIRFNLQSYTASPSENGWGTTYSPVVLHQGQFTTTHATLSILDVNAAITGTRIWFWANTTGDGELTPIFRWTDENGTMSSMGSAGVDVQGRLSMGQYGISFGAGPYTAFLDLRNDRGEQVTSQSFLVQRR